MYLVVFNILFSFLYLFVRTKKNIHILQQNFYNENNRYIKWGNKNFNQVYKLDIIVLIINLINLFLRNNILCYSSLLYLVLFFIENIKLKKEQVKIPLKVTSRVKRLVISICILYLLSIVSYIINKYEY